MGRSEWKHRSRLASRSRSGHQRKAAAEWQERLISLTSDSGCREKRRNDRGSVVRSGSFRPVTAALAALQPFNELSAERAIEALLGFNGKTDKLHAELMPVHPFDRTEIDGECRRLMVEEHTHAHVTAAEDFPIAQNGTALERQIRQDTFSDKGAPPKMTG